MNKFSLKNVLFVFVLGFICFLVGWATAVYVFPGKMSPEGKLGKQVDSFWEDNEEDSFSKESLAEEQEKPLKFFEEMKENVMILFDPYKMDSALKQNLHLENSPYKEKPDEIVLKKPAPQDSDSSSVLESAEKPPEDFSQQEQTESDLVLTPLTEETEKPQSPADLLLQEIQKEYDKQNHDQLKQIDGEQDFFKVNGKYSFFINAFSDQEEALEYIEDMKKLYSLWSFLIKAHKDHIRIYLGPFESKEKAEEFKKILPQPSPFNLDFLEEISL